MRPYHWARDEIARLDPTVDHERIVRLSTEARFGFPPLAASFYTVNFLRQVAVPSIARTLHRGGGGASITTPRKRNDDTLVFFGELFGSGPTSPRGQEALERMNEIHSSFRISNDEYLYTLTSTIAEGERTSQLIGLELLSWSEKQASYRFWRSVGEGMGLSGIPGSYDAAFQWALDYEREHWAPTEAGRAVARSVLGDYAGRWVPDFATRFTFSASTVLLGPELRAVHGFPEPPRALERAVIGGLRHGLRARGLLPDPSIRSIRDEFGSAYGSCPHLAEVGYRPPVRETAIS